MCSEQTISALVLSWALSVDRCDWNAVRRWEPLLLKHRTEALPHLTQLLKDNSAQVRRMTAKKLTELDPEHQYDQDIANLLHDSQADVRLAAAESLGARSANACDILLTIAKDTKSVAWMRLDAIRALGKIGNLSAVPALVAMLSEHDKNVEKQCLCALSDIGKPAVEQLTQVLLDGSANVEYRRNACMVLGHIADSDVLPALVACGKEPISELQRWVAWALGQLPYDPRSIQALVTLCTGSNHLDVTKTAVESLGKLRAHEAADAIKQQLSSTHAEIRTAAINAAISADLVADSAPLLSEILHSDDDAYCRLHAALALATFDNADARRNVERFRDTASKLFTGKERKRIMRQLEAALEKSQ